MKEVIRYITKRKSFLKGITALTLVMVIFILPSAAGFAAVDVNKEVSLTVKPSGGGDQAENEFSDDISNAHIVLDLYKVADIQPVSGYDTYEFAAIEEYGILSNKSKVSIENKDMDSAEWKALTQEAAANALGTAYGAEAKTPVVEGAAIDSRITGLSAGLYLVIARGSTLGPNEYIKTGKDKAIYTIANSDLYEYRFAPELVALPTKDANDDGVINTANAGEWKYDETIYLKAERDNLRASIKIVKKLDSYETSYKTKDTATFVFHVYDTDTQGKTFDNYYSTVFDKPNNGTGQEILIPDLPAGLKLTVEEVYRGGNYKLTTDDKQQVTVSADKINGVEFTNTYDDTYKGGGSITNKFENDTKNGWQHVEGKDDDGNDHANK